jgi:hypothetical protein
MRKMIMALILAVILSIAFAPVVIEAGAESMNFKAASMIDKVERVKVTLIDGVTIGVVDRRGLAIFENGDVATMSCRAIFDTKKGFQGYSSMSFDDGSTLVLSWKGPTSILPPGGKYRGYSMKVEYAKGTGRFEGIKGSGTFTAKIPQWNKEYKAMDFGYYKFSGTYTLP